MLQAKIKTYAENMSEQHRFNVKKEPNAPLSLKKSSLSDVPGEATGTGGMYGRP